MRKPQAINTQPDKGLGLSAINLKETLWETLKAIKGDAMLPGQGDAIAAQAREILRTVKVQLQVASQAKRPVPSDVIVFTES
jgi:hypothetical protein